MDNLTNVILTVLAILVAVSTVMDWVVTYKLNKLKKAHKELQKMIEEKDKNK